MKYHIKRNTIIETERPYNNWTISDGDISQLADLMNKGDSLPDLLEGVYGKAQDLSEERLYRRFKMSNMSHCRFENTLADMQDCLGALHDGLDFETLSDTEKSAAKHMLSIAGNLKEVLKENIPHED